MSEELKLLFRLVDAVKRLNQYKGMDISRAASAERDIDYVIQEVDSIYGEQ